MDKKMRKRMTLMEYERDRALNAQFATFSSPKSFDEIKEEREASMISSAAAEGGDFRRGCSHDDERDDECNNDASMMYSDCVGEMRRRRVYEMTHHRPYPTRSTKKKHKFWQPEEPPGPAVQLLSPSFSERSSCSVYTNSDKKLLTTRNASSSLCSTTPGQCQQSSLSSSPKMATARVLWKVETVNLQHDLEAMVLDNDGDSDERQRMKDCFIKDEIMDGIGYEDDEIMTPVRIKKFISIYDDVKNDEEEREGFAVSPSETEASFIDFTPSEIDAAVAEISTATQALAAFVTSAVDVMKEAKTPEKKDNSISEHFTSMQEFEPRILDQTTHAIYQEATPFKASTLSQEKAMTTTPSNKLITKVQTPMTTKTIDSSMDEADIMNTKLGLGNDDDDDNDAHIVIAKVDNGVLWPSLFHNEESDVEASFVEVDSNSKAMLEALVEGGALQREIDGKNILKLFVDMYHKHTFEKIVHSIKELKGLQALVICRGLDQSRPTYRTVQEIKSLLDATRAIEQLDSLMLLNFTSDSLTNLAMVIHQQPSIYRLQIQLADGTLNGEILGVMATAPRLTHVMLELKESCSLGTLMNSKTLQSVRVNSRSLELKKSHVRTLVYSLQSNFTLTSLDLAPAISVEHFRTLCVTLKRNYRLESLRVNLEIKTEEESSIAALELANLFRENNFLINVWNYSYQSCAISETNKRDVFAALRNNKSMQDFKFFSEDIGDWKNAKAKGGNPSWMEANLNNAATDNNTITTIDGPRSVRMRDGDASVSLLSGSSSVGTESLRGDEFLELCGMIDSSTFSIPCDFAAMRNMSTDFHNWATATTKKVQRMEV